EGRPDHDVALVELPHHETAVIAPLEQAFATAFGNTFELGSETAQIVEPHRGMFTGPPNALRSRHGSGSEVAARRGWCRARLRQRGQALGPVAAAHHRYFGGSR